MKKTIVGRGRETEERRERERERESSIPTSIHKYNRNITI